MGDYDEAHRFRSISWANRQGFRGVGAACVCGWEDDAAMREALREAAQVIGHVLHYRDPMLHETAPLFEKFAADGPGRPTHRRTGAVRIGVGVVVLVALTFGAALWQRRLWRREARRRILAGLTGDLSLIDWSDVADAFAVLGYTTAELVEGFRRLGEALRVSEGRG